MIVLTIQPNYFLAIDADVGTASSDTKHEVVAEISRRTFYHAADQTRRHSRPIASGSTGTAPVYIDHVSLRSTDGKARGLRGFVLPEVSRLWRKFLGPFEAARRHFRLSRCITLQACQQSTSCISKAFHYQTLSAGLTGLIACGDGHTIGERKRACPTRDGSKMTRNGANAS